MNVLLIHQHFSHPGEGGAIRSYSLAKFLINSGHSVEVISRKNGISQPKQEMINGISVHYLPVEYSNDMGFLTRIPAYLKFVVKSILYVQKLNPTQFNINYCISTPLTSGLIGLWLKRRYRLRFIFEVGDLWPDAPIAIKAVRFPLTRFILKGLEKYIYRNAEAVIGLSPSIVSIVKSRTASPVFYVPNFADIDFFKPVIKNNTGPFNISYIGTLGRANELEYMLAAARECQKRNLKIHFNVMGEGARRIPLMEKAKSMSLTNITFNPFGNKEAVKNLLNKTDAAYISYKKLPVLETGSPNKFFDALAAGKMIILNFRGWLNKYVDDYSCGFSYDPEDVNAFILSLMPYLHEELLLKQVQANSRKLAIEEFSLQDWQKRFVSIVEQCEADKTETARAAII